MRSVENGRLSMPRLSSNNRSPKLPKCSVKASAPKFSRSLQVLKFSLSIFAAVTLPTPWSFFTASFATKSSTSFGRTANCPSGLFQSLAILARNLFGAMPAEIVMPTTSRTSFRIASAILVALPLNSSQSLTSKKASSSESGSIRSV